MRTQLAGDVETIARHLDTERNRLRTALGDMLSWVDEHVQPAASLLAQPTAPAVESPTAPEPTPRPSDQAGSRTASGSQPAATPRPSSGPTGAGSGATPASRTDDDTSPSDRQGMMPLSTGEGARATVTH